jgi:hypothetical protein
MRSLPVFGLGLSFALAGLGLLAVTLRKAKAAEAGKAGAPLKKSEVREREAEQAARQMETKKMRIAGAVCLALGATVMILS